jgi:hypothetical protein
MEIIKLKIQIFLNGVWYWRGTNKESSVFSTCKEVLWKSPGKASEYYFYDIFYLSDAKDLNRKLEKHLKKYPDKEIPEKIRYFYENKILEYKLNPHLLKLGKKEYFLETINEIFN